MQVLRNEHPWGLDIDDTLLLWDAHISDNLPTISFVEPYTKKQITVAINENNLQLMKEKKARGCAIILWSQGGPLYAEAVALALGIEGMVDLAMGKPVGIIDDLPCTSWMPASVNIPHTKKYKGVSSGIIICNPSFTHCIRISNVLYWRYMNKTIILLADYVNSATDLAELLKEDLKKGKEISDKAILALNRFQKAALALKEITNDINKYVIKNN